MSSGKFTGLFCLLATAAPVSAATVGFWSFDDVVDTTPPVLDPETGTMVDPPGGETFYDSSPNGFDFFAVNNFGTFGSPADRPSVIPAGTSLSSGAGGASLPSTPASSLFSRGNTGALTVEFWFKYSSPTPDVAYVLSFGGGSALTRDNEWGIYGLSTGELKFFDYENGGTGPYPEVGTGALGSDWNHIAFTIDAANAMKAYVNGNLVSSGTSAGLFGGAVSDVLKWGRSHNDSFANHSFLIDELRISDAALLPGAGTGVGELAWNASLVPEPASAMLASMVFGGLLLRKRRPASTDIRL